MYYVGTMYYVCTNYVCTNYVGTNYVGTNYVGTNYVGTNYVGTNYVLLCRCFQNKRYTSLVVYQWCMPTPS